MRQSIWVTGMSCFFTGSVIADQVTLKNGDRLTGTIVKHTAHQNGVRGRSDGISGRGCWTPGLV
ncbi:MAG TPA: hypothetical protein VEW05_22590 [Candidatus Polarisedimenticolia bacterium]|nr:hypothetical protein [Candidatus Polarisedimenticolia bacterium]